MEKEYITRFVPFESFESKKNVENDEILIVHGFANVSGIYDYHNDLVEQGAFSESLEFHKKEGTMPKMFSEHEFEINGFWTHISEHEFGLWIKGEINKKDEPEICKAILNRELQGLSIGFYLQKWSKKLEIINGEKKEIRRIKKAHLIEVSIVGRPANEHSIVIPSIAIENNHYTRA